MSAPSLVDMISKIKTVFDNAKTANQLAGLTTIKAGDDGHPHKTAAHPLLTIDAEDEDLTNLQPTGAGRFAAGIYLRLYVSNPSGDTPASVTLLQILDLVKAVLLAFPAGQGFALQPLTGRRMREQEIPQAKFSAGWELRCKAQALSR